MCPCGGEFTVWCFDHSNWVCDDCGCSECDLFVDVPGWDDDEVVSTTS